MNIPTLIQQIKKEGQQCVALSKEKCEETLVNLKKTAQHEQLVLTINHIGEDVEQKINLYKIASRKEY